MNTDNERVSALPILMRAQIEAEMPYHRLEQRIELLRQTLRGLATNATKCGMCQAHNEVCLEALAADDALK